MSDAREMPGGLVVRRLLAAVVVGLVVYVGAVVLFGTHNVVGSTVAAAIIVAAYSIGPGRR